MILGCNDRVVTKGHLTVIACEDGRALIGVDDGSHNAPWIELVPDVQDWLGALLETIRGQREGERCTRLA